MLQDHAALTAPFPTLMTINALSASCSLSALSILLSLVQHLDLDLMI